MTPFEQLEDVISEYNKSNSEKLSIEAHELEMKPHDKNDGGFSVRMFLMRGDIEILQSIKKGSSSVSVKNMAAYDTIKYIKSNLIK